MAVLDILGSGVFGGLMGGVFRLVPEVLKWADRKNEREHELAMFGKQVDLELTRGRIKLDEIGAQRDAGNDLGVIDAFKLAIESQTELVKAAGGKLGQFVAALSASVRPVLTYYLLLCYGIVKAVTLYAAWANNVPLTVAIPMVYGNEDVAMLSGVINYWMLDRSLMKRGLA